MQYSGPPATSVSVTIHSGREFPSGDIFSKSDPFVKIALGGKEQQTTKKKGTSAVWEQTFTFNYTQESSIKFSLWDKDLIGSDFLGVNDLSLLPILSNSQRHFTGEIPLTHKKGKAAGYLRVTISFYPKGDCSVQTSPPTPTPQQSPSGVQTPVPATLPVQQIVQAPSPVFGIPTSVSQAPAPSQVFVAGQPAMMQQPIYVPVGQQYPPQSYNGQPYPQPAYATQPGYVLPPGYVAQPGYMPQPGYSVQPQCPPQQGYLQPGYPPQQQYRPY